MKDLPDRYPPYQTCHRRFQQWQRAGVLRDLLACLAEDLRKRGKLDLTEGFIDATFAGAKKGAPLSVLRSVAKATNSWLVNRRSLPLAVHVTSASPGEVTPVDATLDARFIDPHPLRLIGDRAYDSDPLDAHLARDFGIDLIAPHRDNRVRPATQDGRALRRYKRRWVVERFFAWLHNSRRLVTRWERHAENFLRHAAAWLHAYIAQALMR